MSKTAIQKAEWLYPAVSIVPFLLVLIFSHSVGSLDLPNHMARAYILKNCLFGNETMLVCENFEYGLSLVPFILSDVILALFLFIEPVFLAEKVAVVFLVGLVGISWFKLYKAVNGVITWPSLLAVFIFYPNNLLNGHYAYILSIGLTLAWLAWWYPRRENRDPKTLFLLCLGLIVIFLCHLAGFLFCAGIYCFWHTFGYVASKEKSAALFWQKLQAILPILLTFLGLYLFQQKTAGSTAGAEFFYKPLLNKIATLFYPVVNFSRYSDLLLFIAAYIVVLSAFTLKSFKTYVSSFWFVCALLFVLAFLFAPTSGHGVYDFDVRFLGLAYFLIPLSLGAYVNVGKVRAVVLAGVIIVWFGTFATNKLNYDSELQKTITFFEHIEKDSKVIQISSRSNFPAPGASRVIAFPYLSNYLIPMGKSQLVASLFDCRYNTNIVYFCYKEAAMHNYDHYKYQFQGLRSISDEDLMTLPRYFDTLFLVEDDGEYVADRMSKLPFKIEKQAKDHYIYKLM